MVELVRHSALGGYRREAGGLVVQEVVDFGLTVLAFREEGAVERAFEVALPPVGQSVVAGGVRFLRVGEDHVFALGVADAPLGDASGVYATDQSDGWVMVRLTETESGQVRERLSLLCMLDLHGGVFGDGAVARTLMEHTGVVIFQEGLDFVLLWPRSYGRALVEALERVLSA